LKRQFTDNLEIRTSGIHGRGVFARSPIQAGAHIFRLTGERVSTFECVRRVLAGRARMEDPLQIGDAEYLILDDVSILFNHSCNPNALIQKTSDLIARRLINAEEEITFYYSLTVKPSVQTFLWSMKCHCGTPNCRRMVSDIRSIDSATLREYASAKGLQDYILSYLQMPLEP
jgi:SET domain-containing protein